MTTLWIPIVFVCFIDDSCSLYHANASISLTQCYEQNEKASIIIQQDPDVKSYKPDCLEIKLKNANFV